VLIKRFPDDIKEFINNTPWTFAKTYAHTWPHHYIVRDRVNEKLFVKAVQHIRRFGYEGWFYKMKITYFDEDGLGESFFRSLTYRVCLIRYIGDNGWMVMSRS